MKLIKYWSTLKAFKLISSIKFCFLFTLIALLSCLAFELQYSKYVCCKQASFNIDPKCILSPFCEFLSRKDAEVIPKCPQQ